VIDVIKTTLYIALDKPDHACEVRRNLTECGMTAFTTTQGIDNDTADGFSDFYVKELIQSLKDGTYKANPVRREYSLRFLLPFILTF